MNLLLLLIVNISATFEINLKYITPAKGYQMQTIIDCATEKNF